MLGLTIQAVHVVKNNMLCVILSIEKDKMNKQFLSNAGSQEKKY